MLITAEIVVAIILIILILLQERSSGMSGLFGGGGADASYQTRRGLEKIVFWATIILAFVFAALSILKLII